MKRMSLKEVMASALDGVPVADDNSEANLAALPTRFPVQVDQQTRVFLEYHAIALNTSISALSGLILKEVVSRSLEEMAEPASHEL